MKLLNTCLLIIIFSMPLSSSAVESEVWIKEQTWEMTFNTGNTDALAELYTTDAIVVPPSLEILNAREQIKNYWSAQKEAGTENFRLQTINYRQNGDVIYQTAIWVATVISNGVATELDGEMTNVIARQSDGSWKIQLQSWN